MEINAALEKAYLVKSVMAANDWGDLTFHRALSTI
jgi:hypothetical protein